MSTHVFPDLSTAPLKQTHRTRDATTYLVPLGRLLFALIFLVAAPGHFSPRSVDAAAAQGVPLAAFAVPLSGAFALVGGLSIALGFHARVGAWLLVLFLVPVTLYMHAFWTMSEPGMHMIQQIMFLKNLGLLGGALLITHFGAGPLSLDRRRPS